MIVKASGRFCLLAFVLLLHGCGGSPLAPVTELSERPRTVPNYYIVKPGETLYSISWAYGRDYREVAKWNGIGRPYRIYPGQKLRLRPPVAHRRSVRRNRSRPSASAKSRSPPRRVAIHSPSRRSTKVSGWIWPTRGPLLRTFSGNDQGKKGIDIGGRQGQPVLAAASGEVVYAGSGLIRYGKLIIIKHNNTYFSAYAHNRKLLVKEGDRVRAGQGIAEMGSTGTTRTMLHFEIRRNGKSVNPLRYLPKK